MINGLKYQLRWKTAVNDLTVRVDIFDTLVQIEDDETVETRELIPAAQPLLISNIDNSRDKFSGCIGKQATISFISDSSYSISTFAQGPDSRWYVEAVREDVIDGDQYIFKGFLSLSDMQQDFLPNPVVVTMVATDHLGLLKDVPFTNDDTDIPKGFNKIAWVIATCLKKTGLSLPINVLNNLKHGSGTMTSDADFTSTFINLPDETEFFYPGQVVRISGTSNNNGVFHVLGSGSFGPLNLVTFDETFTTESATDVTFIDVSSENHFYDTLFLDSKSHEKDVEEYDSCRDVLDAILGEECRLFQYLGEWYIQRIDEMDGNGMNFGIFDANGDFDSYLAQDYEMDIGADENIFFIERSQLIQINGELDRAKLIYPYETPRELPDNVELTRGTGSDPTGVGEETIDYVADDILFLREGSPAINTNIDLTEHADATGVLRKVFIDGYEKERYLVAITGGGFRHYFKFSGLMMGLSDKFILSFDVRQDSDIGGTDIACAHVRLEATDGTLYNWSYDENLGTNEWVLTTGADPWFDESLRFDITGQDNTDFIQFSAECKPLPKDGTIYLRLVNAVSPDEYHFANISIEYKPFITGSYQLFTGQYHQVKREETGYLAKREKDVSISDSPKSLFKGSLHLIKKGTTELYNGSIQFGSPDGFTLSGDVRYKYRPGAWIYIESVTYDNYAKIATSTYNIIGDTTAVTFEFLAVGTVTENGIIYDAPFFLPTWFYTGHVYANQMATDLEGVKPYGKQQVDGVWNQYRNSYRVFSGELLGLTETWPDLIYKFYLTDTHFETNDKTFILTQIEQDWKTERWRGTFIECYDSNNGKTYDDPAEFKYTTE